MSTEEFRRKLTAILSANLKGFSLLIKYDKEVPGVLSINLKFSTQTLCKDAPYKNQADSHRRNNDFHEAGLKLWSKMVEEIG
jgi:hypothetical protein